MKVPPTEQYLCAIHVMLREHWNMEGETIEVRAAQPDGAPRIVSKWQHPGAQQLTLPALIVEANALRATPWEMPQTIGQVCAKLESVGEPFSCAQRCMSVACNLQLAACGAAHFHSHSHRVRYPFALD